MIQTINKRLEKMMPLITPVSVVLGVLLSTYVKDYSFLIPWLFAFMTFSGSLSSSFKSITDVARHPFPVLVALLILHVMMPLWAWGVGHLTFNGDAYTITGLIMAMVIPTGITSFIWVSIYKGNLPLTLSIILFDTLLSPLIVPYSLQLFMGQNVEMDFWGMMKGLLGMIVIPSLLGMILNQVTKGESKKLGVRLAPISKVFLGLVVMLNGSVVAPYLKNINLKLVSIALVAFLIALTGYLFSFWIGRLLKFNHGTVVSLVFTGGMRNISAGAVIAVSFFPAAVAVPVVIGMLFQQVLASLSGLFLEKYHHKQMDNQQSVSI